jgi:hypothetical protein
MSPELEKFPGLDLSRRARSVLARNQITSTEALVRLNARELQDRPGVGKATMKQILDALAEADLELADDPWAPYVCVRGKETGDVSLITFYLCPSCRTEYEDRAFRGAPPEWIGAQLVEGYCGHCNGKRPDISGTQWLVCGICERIVRGISRGVTAQEYVKEVWQEEIAARVPQTMLEETDPPELRPQGRRSEAKRDSIADFTAFNSDRSALFGFEVKSGRKAASKGIGIGADGNVPA